MVTFIGPNAKFTSHGLTFLRGEARPVPPGVAEALSGHPWFQVDVVPQEALPEPKKRGRPRAVKD